jgi:hypothetical protein
VRIIWFVLTILLLGHSPLLAGASWLVASGGNGSSAGVSFLENTTRWTALLGVISQESSESQAQIPIRDEGTFQNLFVRVKASTTTTVTSTVTLRDAALNKGLGVSIGAGLTGGFENSTDPADSSTSSVMNYSVAVPPDPGVANGTLTISVISIRFEADTDTISLLTYNSTCCSQVSNASTSYYYPPTGQHEICSVSQCTDEYKVQYRIAGTYTVPKFSARVKTNGRSTSSSIRTRVNAADGGHSISVPASTTGLFETTSSTDSLISGTDFNYTVVTGTGTGSFDVKSFSSILVSTDDEFVLATGLLLGVLAPSNSTWYWTIGGSLIANSTTESEVKARAPSAFTLRGLSTRISDNSLNGTMTLKLRINGTNGNSTVVIGSGITGLFSDVTGSDEVSAGDDLAIQSVSTGNSGGVIPRWIGSGGPQPRPEPFWTGTAPGSNITTGTSLNVAYPGSLTDNDVLIMQILVRTAPSGGGINTPSGWKRLYTDEHGTDSSAQGLFCKISNGTETGNQTVTFTSSTDRKLGKMYQFRNTTGCPTLNESATYNEGTASPWQAPSITALGDSRTAVAFGWSESNLNGVDSWAGETGGNWIQQQSYNATTGRIQLQTALLYKAGSITGGSDAFTSGTSTNWGTRAFVIIRTGDISSASPTKEFIYLGDRIIAVENYE